MSLNIEKKLLKLKNKTNELINNYKIEKERREGNLEKTLDGVAILTEIAKIPEIEEYSRLRDIQVDYAGGYDVIIRNGNIYYNYTAVHLRSYPVSKSAFKLFNEEIVKELLDKYYNDRHLGLYFEERRFIKALKKIGKRRKEEMIERILNSLL